MAAHARTCEARAAYSVLEASARGPGVAAAAEASFLGGVSAYANAEVCKAEVSVAGAQLGVGLQFNTGASLGPDGVSASVGGFGVAVGPRLKVSTPIATLDCCIM